jgi:hypothetical protein
MKKIIFFLFQLTFVGSLHAQSFNFGISGGVNVSGVYGEQNTATYFSNLTGFDTGAFADYNWKNFTVEPGLYFTTKGYNSNTHLVTFSPEGANPETINTFNATGKITLNYLELPLNLLYNFRLPFGKLFIGGGAFLDYALSGQSRGTTSEESQPGTTTTENSSGNTSFGSGPDEFKKTYLGFDGTAGVRFKNHFLIAFKLQGSFGNIINNNSQASAQSSFKSAGYSVSAGYMFL